MQINRRLVSLLGLLLILVLAGCTLPDGSAIQPIQAPARIAPATGTVTATDTSIHPHLEAALAYAPANTEYFAFTNWMQLKEVAGVPQLTSAANLDERTDFMRALGMTEQAVATAFGRHQFFVHAEEWGWDSTDLLWEAGITTEDIPMAFVLRFREDFDFAAVFEHFEARGFTRSDYAGIPIYRHAPDLRAEWLRTTEFAILNTAFIEEEKLFVLGSDSSFVTALLDANTGGQTLADLPAMRAVAASLGEVGTAILQPFGCQMLDVASMVVDNNASPEALADQLEELRQIGINGVYTVFGLGYRPEPDGDAQSGLGVIVLHYLAAEQARADLEPRRQLAETGTSLRTSLPYAEFFEVVEAEVIDEADRHGADLVLTLRARERPPQLFFNMLFQRDLLFTVCGGF